jgi:hypothetical protein
MNLRQRVLAVVATVWLIAGLVLVNYYVSHNGSCVDYPTDGSRSCYQLHPLPVPQSPTP